MESYLAIDIGASGGRHILGTLDEGKLTLTEIYRFENRIDEQNGVLTWDTDRLFAEILNGMKACGGIGHIPRSVAIDTWGVDYVLLDKDGKEILPVHAYRDPRTDATVEKVRAIIPAEELYSRTGIQHQAFNTVFQLYTDKLSGKLEKASRALLIPEYFAYKLCGVAENEYTNASTTAMLDAPAKDWDGELLDCLGIPRTLFTSPKMPPVFLGELKEDIQTAVGYNTRVVLCPTHDTACAVAAGALSEDSMYVSSGTWSLAGIEISEPITTPEAMKANYTNEGGIEGRYRFLKNIMGMWLFQSIRRDTGKKYTYDEMMEMAMASSYEGIIDVNDRSLNHPDSMIEAVRALAGKPELPLGDVLACVYRSLAESYKKTADEIEAITDKKIGTIRIFGGGSADRYLNALTAKISGRTVVAGLKEATAAGNLISQILCDKPHLTLADLRKVIRDSFDFEEVHS